MARILIVEDDVSISRMYEFRLKSIGHDIRCAYDGEEGLRTAEEFLPNLLLLDLKMPVLNGDEMLEKLRATAWGSEIRVIILTNISRSEAP